jgi:hypothetical protein
VYVVSRGSQYRYTVLMTTTVAFWTYIARIFQVTNYTSLPPQLEAFLLDSRFKFCGCNVGGDISKIFTTYKKENKMRGVRRLKMGKYVSNRGVTKSGIARMDGLHKTPTGKISNKELQTSSDWNLKKSIFGTAILCVARCDSIYHAIRSCERYAGS